jgi:hypothetical protein
VIAATLNEALPLQMLLTDGRTDLFGRVRLYNAAGALVNTLNLAHVAEGLYQISWTPTQEGWFTAVFEMFFDSGRTLEAGYEKQGEQIEVSTTKTSILRILGLVHENSVIDQQVYDPEGHLTAARIRTYDSKANAQAAGLTGLRFQYTVQAEFTGGVLTKYQILRDA